MALKIIGQGKFGAQSTDKNAQSVSSDESVSETTAKDKDGNIIGVALTEHVTEKTVEVLATDGDEPPAVGEPFDGGTVLRRSESSSNSDFTRWSVTVKIWHDIKEEQGTSVVQS
jgi:hypothetical protein